MPPPPPPRKGSFVTLEPFTVPVTSGNKVAYEKRLTVKIEVANESAVKKVSLHLPRLRDAFLRDLYDSPAFVDAGRGPIDFAPVQEAMLISARHVVDADLVVDVIVTNWKLPPIPSLDASPEIKKRVKSSGH